MEKNDLYSSIFVAAGAIGTELIRRVFTHRGKKKLSEAEQIRKELRDDVRGLNERISQLHYDLDSWKKRYYHLVEENIVLKGKCHALECAMNEMISGRKPERIQLED